MENIYKEFNNVSVKKQFSAVDMKYEVEINWSSIGSVSIDIAEQFKEDLQKAIDFAKTI